VTASEQEEIGSIPITPLIYTIKRGQGDEPVRPNELGMSISGEISCLSNSFRRIRFPSCPHKRLDCINSNMKV
jgi:hypothetical protein